LYLVVVLPVAITDGRRVLSGLLYTKVSAEIKIVPPKSHVEVTIDLEPTLAEIEDFSPTGEVYATDREALTAKFERIRAECFQHPVSQALMEQIGTQVQQVIIRTIDEALIQEVKEHLGPVLGRPSSLSRRIKDTGEVVRTVRTNRGSEICSPASFGQLGAFSPYPMGREQDSHTQVAEGE